MQEKVKKNIIEAEKYNIVYADPPWPFNDRKVTRKDGKKPTFGIGAGNHYSLLSTQDICKIPVQNITATNCALFLWTMSTHFEDALDVIKAWGFKLINRAFLWSKTYRKCGKPFFGPGYWTRRNAEDCLFALKGDGLKAKSHSISELVLCPHPTKGKKIIHSRKPGIIRSLIVKLLGDLPRVELFSRERIEGWDCMGLESNGKDIRYEL